MPALCCIIYDTYFGCEEELQYTINARHANSQAKVNIGELTRSENQIALREIVH